MICTAQHIDRHISSSITVWTNYLFSLMTLARISAYTLDKLDFTKTLPKNHLAGFESLITRRALSDHCLPFISIHKLCSWGKKEIKKYVHLTWFNRTMTKLRISSFAGMLSKRSRCSEALIKCRMKIVSCSRLIACIHPHRGLTFRKTSTHVCIT